MKPGQSTPSLLAAATLDYERPLPLPLLSGSPSSPISIVSRRPEEVFWPLTATYHVRHLSFSLESQLRFFFPYSPCPLSDSLGTFPSRRAPFPMSPALCQLVLPECRRQARPPSAVLTVFRIHCGFRPEGPADVPNERLPLKNESCLSPPPLSLCTPPSSPSSGPKLIIYIFFSPPHIEIVVCSRGLRLFRVDALEVLETSLLFLMDVECSG